MLRVRPSVKENHDCFALQQKDVRALTKQAQLKKLLTRVQELYIDVCDELERTDPEDYELCLLLSNCTDDLNGIIEMERSS